MIDKFGILDRITGREKEDTLKNLLIQQQQTNELMQQSIVSQEISITTQRQTLSTMMLMAQRLGVQEIEMPRVKTREPIIDEVPLYLYHREIDTFFRADHPYISGNWYVATANTADEVQIETSLDTVIAAAVTSGLISEIDYKDLQFVQLYEMRAFGEDTDGGSGDGTVMSVNLNNRFLLVEHLTQNKFQPIQVPRTARTFFHKQTEIKMTSTNYNAADKNFYFGTAFLLWKTISKEEKSKILT